MQTMNRTLSVLGAIIIISVGIWYVVSRQNSAGNFQQTSMTIDQTLPTITPIMHATAVLAWGDTTIYTDPTGEAKAFAGQKPANIVVVTDIHGDHLSTSTLEGVVGENTALIVPQAVKDLLPAELAAHATVLGNGDTIEEQGFSITAIPMYNIPVSPTAFHTKGRGNGYVIEKDDTRVYIAGDTSDTPEMDALKDIDIALLPMNLPYTMSVEDAAKATLAFKPAHVYPYHYRGPEGLADVNKFKSLVNAGDPNIDVVLLDWYPNQ